MLTINPVPKHKPIRLSKTQMRKLQLKVHKRDGNMCICGKHTKAPPHHIQYRKQGGDDAEYNLITL